MKLNLLGYFSTVNYKHLPNKNYYPVNQYLVKAYLHTLKELEAVYIYEYYYIYIYIYLHIKGRLYYQYVKHNVKTINMKDISQVWLCMELYQLKSRHNLRYKSAGNDASQWRKCQLTRDGDTEASLSMGVRFMSIEIIQTCRGPSMEDPQ